MTATMTMSLSRALVAPVGTLSALALDNSAASNFHFGQFTGSGLQWERQTATSPWVHGRRLRSARKSSAQLEGEFYVITAVDSAPGTHDGHLADLLDVLSQWTWTLQITATAGAGANTWEYQCEPADVIPGESHMVAASHWWTTLQVTIPHAPIPNSGAW